MIVSLKKNKQYPGILHCSFDIRCSISDEDIDTFLRDYHDVILNKAIVGNDEFFKKIKSILNPLDDESIHGQLFNNDLEDADMSNVIDRLRSSPDHLTILNLSRNKLTYQGIEELVSDYFIVDHTNKRIGCLKVLILSHNSLTDKVAPALLRLLSHPACVLEKLNLENTDITNKTMRKILCELPSIKELNLAGNSLGDPVAVPNVMISSNYTRRDDNTQGAGAVRAASLFSRGVDSSVVRPVLRNMRPAAT